MTIAQKIGVYCVDDNPLVVDAIRVKLAKTGTFEVTGSLSSADGLVDAFKRDSAALVLLDLDMPGIDPLDAAAELVRKYPHVRVVILSGHVRPDLIERALQAGVWGYVSKNDTETELVSVLRRVIKSQIGLSTEARSTYDRL